MILLRVSLNERPRSLFIVTAIIVPAAVSSIVVISQNNSINGCLVILGRRNVRDTVVLFAYGFFDDEVVLWRNILSLVVKVHFVIFSVLFNCLGAFHVKTNWQNSTQSEIWVLDVVSINFFVLI